MCIAIPMQVQDSDGLFARCLGRGQERRISLALLGEVSVGSWVLVHLDQAREVIDARRAQEINHALDAVEQVMQGNVDMGLFDDLLNREPQLPDFLRQDKKNNRNE